MYLFQLAKLGIDIVLISRTKAKLEAVAAEIGMNRKKMYCCLHYYLVSVSYKHKSCRET
jgi:short-subunit dehydrogenase